MNHNYLIIEDNPTDAELILDSLRPLGKKWHHTLLQDGQEAVEYIQKVSDNTVAQPRMILLDLKLPKYSGLDILKLIKSQPQISHIPVIIFTSSQSPEDMKVSYDAGVNAYVVKPIGFKDFEKTVQGIGKFWFFCNSTLHE